MDAVTVCSCLSSPRWGTRAPLPDAWSLPGRTRRLRCPRKSATHFAWFEKFLSNGLNFAYGPEMASWRWCQLVDSMWSGTWTPLKPNTPVRNNSYLKFLSQCNVASVLPRRLQMNDFWVLKYHGAHTHPPTESRYSPAVPMPEIATGSKFLPGI